MQRGESGVQETGAECIEGREGCWRHREGSSHRTRQPVRRGEKGVKRTGTRG